MDGGVCVLDPSTGCVVGKETGDQKGRERSLRQCKGAGGRNVKM